MVWAPPFPFPSCLIYYVPPEHLAVSCLLLQVQLHVSQPHPLPTINWFLPSSSQEQSVVWAPPLPFPSCIIYYVPAELWCGYLFLSQLYFRLCGSFSIFLTSPGGVSPRLPLPRYLCICLISEELRPGQSAAKHFWKLATTSTWCFWKLRDRKVDLSGELKVAPYFSILREVRSAV